MNYKDLQGKGRSMLHKTAHPSKTLVQKIVPVHMGTT